MVFSSITFLFMFFPAVLLLYLIVPERFKNLFLMATSLIFYFWGENFLTWIIIAVIVINFFAALYIDKAGQGSEKDATRYGAHRAIGLGIAVTASLGLLGFFKYADFFVNNLNSFISLIDSAKSESFVLPHIVLPLGISFYIFQAMSYTIDVYRGDVKSSRSLVDFACYVTLFPQLVAGPIVRYRDIEIQLKSRRMSIDGFSEGIFRFSIGLAKKVLIANSMAVVADAAFMVPTANLGTAFAWVGCLCYTLQIYFDFSGYSDMAIGLGHIFGFRFLENFNYPYISDSIQEFWRRWHISLSTWFRDYLYIPLGGNRKGALRTYINLFTVFLLCGLWHGASWNFVLWGGYHGMFLVIERMGLGSVIKRAPRFVRHGYVIVVVMVGWVFFRAETLSGAIRYLKAMAGFAPASAGNCYELALYCDSMFIVTAIAAIIASMPVMESIKLIFFRLNFRLNEVAGSEKQILARALLCLGSMTGYLYISALFFLSVLVLSSGAYNPFIYFKF